MTANHPATELQLAVRANDTKLFASLELSKSQWLVTVSAPGSDEAVETCHDRRRR